MNEPQNKPVESPAAEAALCPERQPYTLPDFLFSILFLFVGRSYWEILFGDADLLVAGGLDWKLPVFVLIFVGVSLAYMLSCRIRPTAESWFWLAVTVLLGLGGLHTGSSGVLGNFLLLALHFSAVYWVLSATGRLLGDKKTSNWVFFDCINLLFIIPWVNFGQQVMAFFGWLAQKFRHRKAAAPQKEKKKSKALPVLVGILLAVLCLLIVLPLLFHADSRFEALFSDSFGQFSAWIDRLFWGENGIFSRFNPVLTIMSLLVSFWLFGVVHGCIHGKHTGIVQTTPLQAVGKKLRLAPNVTLSIMLFALSAVYLLFIGFQASYLFGAFAGKLPAGFSHAAYARNGFFELCAVAGINLAFLLGANLTSKTPYGENKLLRAGNITLSALTLLLLTTAASKMGLYMQTYGLTVKRLLVMVFLVWIALVYVGIILLQFFPFPLTKIAVFLLAGLFTLFCLFPVEQLTEAYNQKNGHVDQDVIVSVSADHLPNPLSSLTNPS